MVASKSVTGPRDPIAEGLAALAAVSAQRRRSIVRNIAKRFPELGNIERLTTDRPETGNAYVHCRGEVSNHHYVPGFTREQITGACVALLEAGIITNLLV